MMTLLVGLLVVVGVLALVILISIKENTRRSAERLEEIASTLSKGSMAAKMGEADGVFWATAKSAAGIYNLLNSETGYEEKARLRYEELRRQRDEQYREKYGERDRLNAEWAKQYDAGATRLDFLEWLKENHKDFKYPSSDN